MKLAVDLLGSDLGSVELQKGIISFLDKNKDVSIIAVGKTSEMALLNGRCELLEAPEVVPMEAGALEVMRMKNSSMYKAIELVKNNEADGVISAGSTGGFLSASTIVIKNAQNVTLLLSFQTFLIP